MLSSNCLISARVIINELKRLAYNMKLYPNYGLKSCIVIDKFGMRILVRYKKKDYYSIVKDINMLTLSLDEFAEKILVPFLERFNASR